MLTTVLLASLGGVLLEPKPPDAFKRLHPRSVSASSILRDSYNRFEQNYLPVYVADDAPGTAWVEGAKGQGIGESLTWVGPQLAKAQAVKVFVRNGLQASKAFFLANSRLKKIRLEPLSAAGEAGKAATPGGAPLEVELKSVEGWQEIDVPVSPTFSAMKLTVLSVYPGSRYQDTCLSDLRVYVKGDDKYSEEAELKARDVIKAFIDSREKLKLQLAGDYTQQKLYAPAQECQLDEHSLDPAPCLELLAADAPPRVGELVARAKRASETAREVDVSLRSASGWSFVAVKNAPAATRALEPVIGAFPQVTSYLDRRSVALSGAREPKDEHWDFAMARGAAKSPTALLWSRSQSVTTYSRDDERESHYEARDGVFVVTYAGDLAEAVVELADPQQEDAFFRPFRENSIFLFNWAATDQGPALQSVVSVDFPNHLVLTEWSPKVELKVPKN